MRAGPCVLSYWLLMKGECAVTSNEYSGIAAALITGGSFILGIASKLWQYAKRQAVLEERLNLLWEAQLRRGHFELLEKGYASEISHTESRETEP